MFFLTWLFWRAAIERAVKSGAQGAGLAWFGSDAGLANLYGFDWQVGLGAAGGMALLSLLTSLGSGAVPAGDSRGMPSLTGAERLPDADGD